jgi:hypothetical protein
VKAAAAISSHWLDLRRLGAKVLSMIKVAVLAIPLIVLISACNALGQPEEVRACEAFIKERLRSPVTYHRAELTVGGDEPVTQAKFDEQYIGSKPGELSKLLRARVKGKQLALRNVFIHYDADNAYGTPIRGLEMCEFLVVDGRLDSSGDLESRAKSTASNMRLREVMEQLNNAELRSLGRRDGSSLTECCVRY